MIWYHIYIINMLYLVTDMEMESANIFKNFHEPFKNSNLKTKNMELVSSNNAVWKENATISPEEFLIEYETFCNFQVKIKKKMCPCVPNTLSK